MPTLKQLVDETTNIKNELKTCHTNLKSNLTDKGVEVATGSKMLVLINKIKDIQTINQVTAGDTNSFSEVKGYDGRTTDLVIFVPLKTDKIEVFRQVLNVEGSIRINFKTQSSTDAITYPIFYVAIKDSVGNIIDEKSTPEKPNANFTFDLSGIKNGYYLVYSVSNRGSLPDTIRIKSIKITYDLKG